MEPIYANPENTKHNDKYQTDFKRTEKRRHGAVVLCLGLLTVFLLAGLIGLSVHNHKSTRGASAEFSTMKTNLTELLQEQYWEQQEPNNGGIHGNEDCSQIRAQKGVWNDLPCGASLLWICEL
ncbi:hypothetical protein Q5P01_013940 [Channa striata]|uniref:C-type lectin domain-containing protein n=1 Tax=Channa striata TaxID=64152 RepID=A0AA88MNU5_CHASR|nr:hypothetical protein Q5P01_013940 [Channa striata]